MCRRGREESVGKDTKGFVRQRGGAFGREGWLGDGRATSGCASRSFSRRYLLSWYRMTPGNLAIKLSTSSSTPPPPVPAWWRWCVVRGVWWVGRGSEVVRWGPQGEAWVRRMCVVRSRGGKKGHDTTGRN